MSDARLRFQTLAVRRALPSDGFELSPAWREAITHVTTAAERGDVVVCASCDFSGIS